MIKKKFKITGMHCSSCAMSIDMDLEDLEGIEKVQTSYAKEETEVEYDLNKLSDQKIIDTIKQTGYTAEPC
ncbi:heavy-metal-associated domain-containing protein [Candidatus Daviesbacteria bacterium]|nr:heavy-metal-associated domain-containing protein [Candidatus Daviesbacteria bacterium]